MKILTVLAKISWKTEIETFPVVRYFTQKLEFLSHILWMIVDMISILHTLSSYETRRLSSLHQRLYPGFHAMELLSLSPITCQSNIRVPPVTIGHTE